VTLPLFKQCLLHLLVLRGDIGPIRGFWHALYFSVVTMTTLGFGDIHANPDSWVGQTLLMIQVLLGYILLAALDFEQSFRFIQGIDPTDFSKDVNAFFEF